MGVLCRIRSSGTNSNMENILKRKIEIQSIFLEIESFVVWCDNEVPIPIFVAIYARCHNFSWDAAPGALIIFKLRTENGDLLIF